MNRKDYSTLQLHTSNSSLIFYDLIHSRQASSSFTIQCLSINKGKAHKVTMWRRELSWLNDSYYGDNLSEKLIDWRKKWFMDYLIYDVFLLEWDPSSLISFILSLIWLELGFNQITALIIRAKQMLPRRRGRLIDEKFEKLNKGRMFFWHFSFCLTLCLLSGVRTERRGQSVW